MTYAFAVSRHQLLCLIIGSRSAPDRPQRSQDEPKRTTQSFKVPKSHLQKASKTICFSEFLRIQGLPRQPLKAQEGSQEISAASRGYFEPLWSDFGNKRFLDSFGRLSLCLLLAKMAHLGSIWSHVGTHFGSHFGIKSAQEEPR